METSENFLTQVFMFYLGGYLEPFQAGKGQELVFQFLYLSFHLILCRLSCHTHILLSVDGTYVVYFVDN
jgi:hypothetical protein